jgi:hypothetical protein
MRTDKTNERGAALIMALLTLALLLAMAMGISLTAISELGVSRTYETQTTALQTAEAGLNHAASLVSNYTGADFSSLLQLRSTPLSTDYFEGNNPFTIANASYFASGSVMIPNETERGYQLRRDPTTNELVPDAYYRVSLIDDEPSTSAAQPRVPNFNPGAGYRELQAPDAANPSIDRNNRLVIYSTGTYLNASVTLEGWVAFLPFPALSANQNIEISGSANIRGAYGAVHSNGNMLERGASWRVEQTVTASGSLIGDYTGQVGGFYGGGQARLDLPEFVTRDPLTPGGPETPPRLQDFLIRRADVLLIDPGFADGAHENVPDQASGNAATRELSQLAARLNVDYSALAAAMDSGANQGNNVQQNSAVAIRVARANPNAVGIPTRIANVSDIGWSYGGGLWGILTNNNAAGGNNFYVIGRNNYPDSPNGGNVVLNGNIGGNGAPLSVTIFTTGSILVTGNANISANLRNLQTPFLPPFVQIDALMFAVQDVQVRGDFNASIAFTGVTYAGEAVDLSGNGSINGQVIAYNFPNVPGSLVQGINGDPNANVITGSFELTLNNGNSVGRIKLFSWRQIKR